MTQQLDKPAIKAEISALYGLMEPRMDALFNLVDRWADEREYEDFNDYVSYIKATVPAGWEFVKAVKVGFVARHEASKRTYKLTASQSGMVRVVYLAA